VRGQERGEVYDAFKFTSIFHNSAVLDLLSLLQIFIFLDVEILEVDALAAKSI
jgi:hypothetical protein